MDHDDEDDFRGGRPRQPEGSRRRDRGSDEPPPALYSIHQGRVVSIRDFGIFVRMDGLHRQGLVHKSQLSSQRVEKIEDFIDMDARVFVKVIGIEDGTNKVSLSLKYVSQSDGKDLDENNVQLSMVLTRSKKYQDQPPPMTEEQIYSHIVCERCQGVGHASRDCHNRGVKYDIIQENDDGAEKDAERQIEEIKRRKLQKKMEKKEAKLKRKQEKKEKKEKKKEKKRKRKEEKEAKKQERKSKKHSGKKQKQKHSSDSGSESDSNSDSNSSDSDDSSDSH